MILPQGRARISKTNRHHYRHRESKYIGTDTEFEEVLILTALFSIDRKIVAAWLREWVGNHILTSHKNAPG
jgi:hypothetical protein